VDIVFSSDKQNVTVLNLINEIVPVSILSWMPSKELEHFPLIKLPLTNGISLGEYLKQFFDNHLASQIVDQQKEQYWASEARVLLVEDNSVNQRILQRILKSIGYKNITLVPDGTKAVEIVEKDATFDVILMDIMMPGKSGIEATREIRRLPRSKQPRCIIGITADVITDTQRSCLEAGMQDCLTKPVDHQLLKSKMDKYFRK